MRIPVIFLMALLLSACGPATFGSKGSDESSKAEGTANEAGGSIEQLCTDHGLVAKQSDCSSDDDSSSQDDSSSDDDSVDGVSADGTSSDDDSSDDKACANLADCLKKKCEAPPVQ